MIVGTIRPKIIRTVLFCVVYTTVVHNDTHTHHQFLKMSVGLGLRLAFVRLCRFRIFVFFSGLP